MKKWFTDCDVIIDLLTAREPFFRDSALIFQQAQDNKIRIITSSLAIANIYYIIKKSKGDKETRAILTSLLTLITVAMVDEVCIQQAIGSEFKDFEDAIQYFVAKREGCDGIVTRNIKDYKMAKLKVITPRQLV